MNQARTNEIFIDKYTALGERRNPGTTIGSKGSRLRTFSLSSSHILACAVEKGADGVPQHHRSQISRLQNGWEQQRCCMESNGCLSTNGFPRYLQEGYLELRRRKQMQLSPAKGTHLYGFYKELPHGTVVSDLIPLMSAHFRFSDHIIWILQKQSGGQRIPSDNAPSPTPISSVT
ncbi:hypothetical protein PAAG_08494 [Paracoccidioides lutzii Pb01]|uniref:Uncharacterized protein n=1 Tax=Paracoccidioides lutzii (strain ATCC MYA-826 / Pb01) TaxID=502779 RepID=C1HCK3_PARBA|nr:hypothetical protein PAAG_08494 [Paracoccidioides lutzii Pb01]EEH38767.2 hypothetical protein PAAG_08494 [Paracoccidioides lutzii Pb01]